MQDWKLQDRTMTDWTMTGEFLRAVQHTKTQYYCIKSTSDFNRYRDSRWISPFVSVYRAYATIAVEPATSYTESATKNQSYTATRISMHFLCVVCTPSSTVKHPERNTD